MPTRFFDFSGYTDIARGLGLAFGFRWPENFRAPYLAPSIREFWRRWHMTLSRFMRDYVYIPLGGNRGRTAWSAFTVMVTLTLGGFWHGASWTFLLWGAMHGVFLIIHRGWEKLALLSRFKSLQKIPSPIRWFAGVALTFNIVCLARAFFRLTHVTESWECLRKVVSFDHSKMLAGGANDLSIWVLLIVYGLGALCFAALRRSESVPAFFASARPPIRARIARRRCRGPARRLDLAGANGRESAVYLLSVLISGRPRRQQRRRLRAPRLYIRRAPATWPSPISPRLSSAEEAQEYLRDLGVTGSGVSALIRAVYHLLGLRTYLTTGEKETRAWTIHEGDKAPAAAGVIHTDFERGFIAAEVVHFDDLVGLGSMAKAREAGKLRIEGKEYVVQDGDVVEFRFNV